MAVVVNRPSVNVTVTSTAPGRDRREASGRFHVVGLTYRGTSTPQVVRGMTDFARLYGARQSWSDLYNAAEVFFAEGGSELVVSRVVGPSAVSSSVDVDDQQGSAETAVTVTAVSAGAWGDDIDVTFANGTSTGATTMTVEYNDTAVEVYTNLTPAELVEATSSSDYVRVTIGDTSATGDQARPAAGEVSLASGDDDRDNITDDEWDDALAALTDGYGHGQVAAPGQTSGTITAAVADHAEAFNRVALIDVSSTVATASTAATALRSAATDASYAGLFTAGLQARLNGVVRDVPSSAVAAGLMARNDRSRSVNEPAAGVNGICQTIVTAPVYTDAVRNTLTVAGINAFKTVDATVRLYEYVSADTSGAWPMLSNVRLRMSIVADASEIAERYLFSQIDGAGRLIAEYAGDLNGMLAGYYEDDALYGATPAEAYIVDTSENNDVTAANRQLLARIGLRMSPFADVVFLEIVKVATDSVLAA